MPNTDTILLVLVAITAVSLLFQFVVLLGLLMTARRGMQMAKEFTDETREAVTPVLQQSRELIQTTRQLIVKLEPKLDSAATDLAELCKGARAQAARVEESAQEITERVRRQAERVDNMTTSALNGVDSVGHFINEAVQVPVRQVSGIVAAAKAIFDSLRSPASPRRRASAESPAREESSHMV